MKAWTQRHMRWVKSEVRFEQLGQEVTLLDYVNEVDHGAARVERLERAIDEAVKSAPERMLAVIEALQALRGIAQISAVTILAELGKVSRFPAPPAIDGLQRHRRQRAFQRRAEPARRYYQNGQCPSSPRGH